MFDYYVTANIIEHEHTMPAATTWSDSSATVGFVPCLLFVKEYNIPTWSHYVFTHKYGDDDDDDGVRLLCRDQRASQSNKRDKRAEQKLDMLRT